MMPAYYALYAQAYMAKNGLTHDDLRDVRLKSATYGTTNERAVYRKGVKAADFDPNNPEAKMAGPVAWPLRVGDCCANADGSSCIILANKEKARALSKKPVWIMGIGAASEAVNMAARPEFAKGLSVGYKAAEQAYKMAGITAGDVKVAEVHDCFTIAEVMAYEGLGFAPMGEGKQLIREKATYKEGRIPVNVDGGLLSKGHPIGATGGSQMRTIVLQLRGEAGPMQVAGEPGIGLVHNVGGVGLYGNVTIFGR
jgi:acetyl-CoA C-acetyltransferase